MTLELDGRVAPVTGAACGPDRMQALALAQAPALADRRAHFAAPVDAQARQALAPIARLFAIEPEEAIG